MPNTVATVSNVYVHVHPKDLEDGAALAVLIEAIAKKTGVSVNVEDWGRARDAADQLLLALGVR